MITQNADATVMRASAVLDTNPGGKTTRGQAPAESNEIARDFEGVFLTMMLKQLRSTGLGEGLFAGDNSDMLGSMFDQYLGEHLADSGGLGLAIMMAKAGVGDDKSQARTLANVSQSASLEAYTNASRIQ